MNDEDYDAFMYISFLFLFLFFPRNERKKEEKKNIHGWMCIYIYRFTFGCREMKASTYTFIHSIALKHKYEVKDGRMNKQKERNEM